MWTILWRDTKLTYYTSIPAPTPTITPTSTHNPPYTPTHNPTIMQTTKVRVSKDTTNNRLQQNIHAKYSRFHKINCLRQGSSDRRGILLIWSVIPQHTRF